LIWTLQAISDPVVKPPILAVTSSFRPMAVLRSQPLLLDPAHLAQLKPPDPATGRRMSDRLAAVRYLHDQVGGEVPVMGWVEGAFAEAADLRGESTFLVDLIERPAWVRDLLEITVETAIAFARAQVEAGADIIGLGDALASQVSPKMYRTFALPYEQRIFQAVRELGALPRLHICGNTTRLLPDMAKSGADIIDLDWMVDLAQAAQIFGDGPAMCGNFDPVRVMLQGTPDQVREAVDQCLRQGGSRLISGAGCEIPDGTPHANLQAQAQRLRLG
jgi:MtaA/CmuA family methyltransferase